MRKVVKGKELEQFSEFKKKNKPNYWEDLDDKLSLQLRSHLIKEKDEYCPYCE